MFFIFVLFSKTIPKFLAPPKMDKAFKVAGIEINNIAKIACLAVAIDKSY